MSAGIEGKSGESVPKWLGITLSFALRLRKRKSGTNQTQIAKKDATSMNVGASLTGCAWYLYRAARERFASCATAAKWKNHMKWSATTSAHESRNVPLVREMYGHVELKCCRYTTWQKMPNTICQKGSRSVKNSSTCRAMIVWKRQC